MWPAMPIYEFAWAISVKSHVLKFGSDCLSLSRVIVVTDRKKNHRCDWKQYNSLPGGNKNPHAIPGQCTEVKEKKIRIKPHLFSSSLSLLLLCARKRIFPKHIKLSCVCDFICLFIYLLLLFFCLCYHDSSWKAQPIRTKFSHTSFDWNSSDRFQNVHRRSHVTSPNRGFLPPLKIQIPSITTITLERLNQSKPNLHTWLLTEIARPSSKMGIAGHM